MLRAFKPKQPLALICQALIAALSIASAGGFAQAATYPAKPVKLVVGFAAGGPTDVVARAFADHASRALGQTFIVDNKPGATNHTMIPGLYSGRVKFDAVTSFKPLCTVATSPTVLVVGPGLPVKSLADYMARARKEPGRTTAGTAGVGSSGHFATEMFARANHLQLNHVPYKGAAPVVTDLMGGQLDSSFATLGSVLPQIRSGKLTALAVASPKRSALLPEVPTFAESGGGQYAADAWYGVLAPAGLPAPIAQQLERVVRDFASSAATVEKLRGLGLEADATCGSAFASQVEREVATYTQIARALDLKAD
ncbi:Bug family tripartite tricarboxylate transporter substrate binding protein [Comamonas aquatica]|uniref:Bug family tripartite tricarboxylate transporter substrate binding protein n=1 Tax=Comamonas aquatica TaxID=225991 RepID=UPI00244D1E47|nr:tripartite tricarboxylate transporter substrate binding protein [Comamonas aquatica]MDH0380758.1 tripartite tricarboxylate transporter substrate binding protein [Comamonas aquatica]MDH0428584.1 tripartite tricarboxylate transporter substrate binding protein [Comamonas aquatica]MDH0940407.1 tripartite tricarboxylate transporter substrate binding protein [Comamonas aquatica]